MGADITVPIEASGAEPPANAASPRRAAPALITSGRRLPRWREIGRFLGEEVRAQASRTFLWVPVAFGLGAAIYLRLAREPPLWPIALTACVALSAAAVTRRLATHRLVLSATWLAAVACVGCLVAKLHSDAVAAPVIPAGFGVASIDGYVVDVASPSERGPRLLIAPIRIGGLAPASTPVRIRLVVPQSSGPEATPPPGSVIHVLALLDPPPGPAAPGAYDFARDAWFEGVGGVGLALRPPEQVAAAPAPPLLRLELAMNAMRWSVASQLAQRIHLVLGQEDGGAAGLAAAVTTSHQDWLAPQHRDALRASGLAHMLAIAGLHTAAVSGFAFFAFRFLIAAWPWLALRVPGKKVAAAAALIVVAGYLALSGAHPPARRAAITASVAFLAILTDRRAVSLHSLALAALLVLLVEPESVLQPGFEMSFCATGALVAMAEIWPRRGSTSGLPWPIALVQRGRDWLFALAMVSLVAGAATGPFSIQHFNRVANYGVFANLAADFLASAVLMPLLALCLAAQAAGLSPAPLYLAAGEAARGVVAIAHLFAGAPGAALAFSSAPAMALALSYLGIVFACLWRGRLRWLGVPLAFAVALWPRPAPPAAWISADGGDAAVVVGDQAVALKPHTRAYETQAWEQRRGLEAPSAPDDAVAALFDCDRLACAPRAGTRPAIAAWWTRRRPPAGRLEALCAHAQIFILRAPVDPPTECSRARLLTPADFRRGGAAEIFADKGGWRFVWAQPMRGVRPWTVNGSGG